MPPAPRFLGKTRPIFANSHLEGRFDNPKNAFHLGMAVPPLRAIPPPLKTSMYSRFVLATPLFTLGILPPSERALLSLSRTVVDFTKYSNKVERLAGEHISLLIRLRRLGMTETPLRHSLHAAVQSTDGVCVATVRNGEKRMNSPGTSETISSRHTKSEDILMQITPQKFWEDAQLLTDRIPPPQPL